MPVNEAALLAAISDLRNGVLLVRGRLLRHTTSMNPRYAIDSEEAANVRLYQQLEQVKPHQPRRRVQVDQNQRFASIEDTVASIDQAAAKAAQESFKAAEKAAKRVAAVSAAHDLNSICTQFQI
jgi:hypothetical protein